MDWEQAQEHPYPTEQQAQERAYPTEQQAQERELARILWQIQQGRNELREIQATKDSIRRRSLRQLVSWVIGISFTVGACWFVGQTLYFFLH